MLAIPRDRKRLWQTLLTLLALLLLTASQALAQSEDFSIVVLPDPQFYASKYTKIGLAQTEWIAQNVSKLQIKFVVTVGDIRYVGRKPYHAIRNGSKTTPMGHGSSFFSHPQS